MRVCFQTGVGKYNLSLCSIQAVATRVVATEAVLDVICRLASAYWQLIWASFYYDPCDRDRLDVVPVETDLAMAEVVFHLLMLARSPCRVRRAPDPRRKTPRIRGVVR